MSNAPSTSATSSAGIEYAPFPKALWPGVKACFCYACEEYLPDVMVAYDDPFGIQMRADTKDRVAVISRTKKTGRDTFVECPPVVKVDIDKLLNHPHRDLRMFKEPLREYMVALEGTRQ